MVQSRPRPVIEARPNQQIVFKPHPRGLQTVNMGFNELPFAPTPAAMEAAHAAVERGNRYGEPTCRVLRLKIGETFGLDPDAIICGNGSEELLDVIARGFVAPGEKILISQYGYIQFPMIAHRLRAETVLIPEDGLTASMDGFLQALDDDCRLIFLALPNNPTGTMPSEADVLRLLDGVPPHVLVVLDLAYGEFVGLDFCARMHAQVDRRPNLVITRTFSKAFAIPAMRVGWCHAPADILPVLYAMRGMGSVNGVAQAAASAALSEIELAMERVDRLNGERRRVTDALREAGLVVEPARANFMLIKPAPDDPRPITGLIDWVYDEAGLIIRPVREGGLGHHTRLSLGTMEQNDLFVDLARRYMT